MKLDPKVFLKAARIIDTRYFHHGVCYALERITGDEDSAYYFYFAKWFGLWDFDNTRHESWGGYFAPNGRTPKERNPRVLALLFCYWELKWSQR